MRITLFLAAVVLPLVGSARAETLHVPSQFPTIQGAIDWASDGDDILVAPGVYGSSGENVVDMLGKAVWLHSSGGPAVTSIDGGNTLTGCRGIICRNGESDSTVIEGFTIQNCFASWYDWNENGSVDYWEFFGGGMWNRNGSSPTVRSCHFINNVSEYGGAICNFDEFYSANEPTIVDCVFQSNTAGAGVGGAIYSNSGSLSVTNCQFIGNSADYGGAVLNGYGSNSTLTGCTFDSNVATADGGAVYNDSSMPTMVDCQFTDNSAADDGGAVFNADPSSSQNVPVFQQCGFSGNTAINEGGGMHNFSVSPVIESCTFSSNSAGEGGGILSWNASNPRISATPFCSNTPTHIDGNWVDEGGNEFADNCEPCLADLDGSGHVGVDDLLIIIAAWGSDDPASDLDGSGTVGVDDLLILIAAWGECS